MRLIALAAASLLSGLFHPAPKPTTTQVYAQGEWRLTVITDTFTKEVRCRLENHNGVHPDVVAVPGGLAFRLGGRGVDTSDAWYKLDDQPAWPWRDLRAQLVAAGSLVDAERLDNPSGGWVIIPTEKIEKIDHIYIRQNLNGSSRIFRLTELDNIMKATRTLRCKNAR